MALAKEMGGESLKVPVEQNILLDFRNQMIVERYLGGETVSSLADYYGIDRTMVFKVLRKLLDDHRVGEAVSELQSDEEQADLFEDQ